MDNGLFYLRKENDMEKAIKHNRGKDIDRIEEGWIFYKDGTKEKTEYQVGIDLDREHADELRKKQNPTKLAK
jgi:hypothetical protein